MAERLKISIVIPCRNEVNFISGCLESVLRCVEIAGAEANIYVVDGKSDDGTIEKINAISQEHPSVQLVVNEKQLTPYAFNLGIHANPDFDYLVIVGSRHILSENYFSEGIRTLEENPEIWCVGGTVNNVFINEFSEIVAAAMGTSFGMGLGNFRAQTDSGFVDTIGTPIYPAHVFEKIGYFDEELVRNQDDEYNYRVTKAGGKIWHNHHITVQYFVRGNLNGLRRQMFQYGYWKVFVNKKHKAVTTMRQLVPPVFVLYLLLLPFSLFAGLCAFLVLASPLAIYLLLGLATGLRTDKAFVQKLKIFLLFPVIHVSYGLGYLKGILDFLLLGRQPAGSAKQLTR